MNEVKIYTLSNPLTGEIKYVGKTEGNLNDRLSCHIRHSKLKYKSHKNNWIKSLLQLNLKPNIELLDLVNKNEWVLMECYWIAQFKNWGFNLTNSTMGGEGASGYKHSLETKKKISLALYKGKTTKLPPNKELHTVHILLKQLDTGTIKYVSDKSKELILKYYPDYILNTKPVIIKDISKESKEKKCDKDKMKAWRKNNPDKIRNYLDRNKERLKEYRRSYRLANK